MHVHVLICLSQDTGAQEGTPSPSAPSSPSAGSSSLSWYTKMRSSTCK